MNLEEEVVQLKEQVKKLQKVLASTGQHVMQLQMHQHKQEIDDIGSKTHDLQKLTPATATIPRGSDYVTESDLGDMVVELQGQLTLLDKRSIKRTLNSRSKSKLLPLPNADGEEHPNFPASIEALRKLSDKELFEQWNHFEMLNGGETLDSLLEKEESESAAVGNKKLLDEMYTSLVQSIGLDPEQTPRIIE